MTHEDLDGMSRQEVLAKYGEPERKDTIHTGDCWIYYYPTIEVYFGRDDMVSWCYGITCEEDKL